MSCRPESITAYVDGELDCATRSAVDAHLSVCAACREQLESERALRAALRALPAPPVPDHLEAMLRTQLGRNPTPRSSFGSLRVWLPLAAVLVTGLLWIRASPPLIALQLARDHGHCFGLERLPAEVFASDMQPVAAWFQGHGRSLPPLPSQVGGLELAGGRLCPMIDRRVAHLYYQSSERHLSVFVIPGPVRLDEAYRATALGHMVHLRRWAGHTIAVVADDARDATTFEHAFETIVADAQAPR